ncbi:biotin--[acetyl-CoA-carboxylase] ligase [Pseudooceanicola algae]|uniref:biotin--[biotin carboxyl-carrier protein] ligase n=1 Tax=Pseudooceanicola algae TaxID=1537215 RepID=A0A418SFD9_9RHOB|nr:biotin--[acetyl-CoA-carboxylase] ligase [Pseudooceanicola algae]QPM89288.1 Bifunctional ligase/repressor BirA [Pseudooceanicola algae]
MLTSVPEDWPGGYDRVVLAETDSTLDEAARRFDTLRRPVWLLALKQTRARGRRGRPWVAPEGNFAATLLLPLAEDPETIALRSFVAALALHEAIVCLTGRPDGLSLKWPNDVLLNGGKVAGILLEGMQRRGLAGVAIGIGVNLLQAPAPEEVEARAVRPASLLQEAGARVTPEEMLNALANAYAAYEVSLRTLGFGPIRQAWLHRASHIGQQITTRFGDTELSGRFETIDEKGHLVLQTGETRHKIAAAEVFF